MKPNHLRFISAFFTVFRLRIKLILKDFTTVGVLITSFVLFALMILGLTTSAQDMSSLPIGVVDYDYSKRSKELILGLHKVESVRIIEKTEAELHRLLLDEMITSFFIIEEGYERGITSGNLNQLITMYYKKDNKSASIISDIVAGEMIYPISYYKSYQYYENLPVEERQRSVFEYESYMKNLIRESKDFDFAFDMRYSNQGKSEASKQSISNSVLYHQFIFGILGILIAFIAMFLQSEAVREKEMGVEVRLRISRLSILVRDFGTMGAFVVVEGLLAALFTSLIFFGSKLQNPRLWLSAYFLLLLNAVVLGIVMLLISKVIGKMLHYQVFCSLLILITGGFGFYHLLTGFYEGAIVDRMIKIIPNSWLIKGLTDIIVYGSEGGYLKEGHRILLIMTSSLILLVIIIDLVQGFQSIQIKGIRDRMVDKNE